MTHLGHLLSYNLNDKDDIKWKKTKPESKLFALYIPSLVLFCPTYSQCTVFVLWSLQSESLNILQVAINKIIIRKIWHLPRDSHTSIVLCVAKCLLLFLDVYKTFTQCMNSDFSLPFRMNHRLWHTPLLIFLGC